jgi:hypothetical protein
MIWFALAIMLWACCVLNALQLIRFLEVRKDGGPESRVTGYWLIEVKWLFSIALLRFDHGSREVFHSHAFDSISLVFGPGQLREELIGGDVRLYRRSWTPVLTLRGTFHRVFSEGRNWVLTFRGPWAKTWFEYDPNGTLTELTHHRRVVWQAEA